MAGQKDPSRTENATPKRIRKARDEGNVHKSQEVTKTVALLVGVVGLFFWIGYAGKEFLRIFRHFLSTAITTFSANPTDVYAMFFWIALLLAKIILPLLLFIAVAVFLVLRAQVGQLWTTKVFTPKLSKFNPIAGIKRMLFSLDTFIRMGKSLLQAICIGIAPWLLIKKESDKFIALYYADAANLTAYILEMGYRMALYALIPMVGIAVIDYFYTKWEYAENLKMTKDEVKDERRQQEGDPQIKSKLRQKMMQISARRMMQQVPKADVVITNPTHIAVALRYNTLEAPAPVVLAKGANRVAERIKEIAREHGIPVRENKPLARALYNDVEIGEAIPEELYQAVAAILAQLWKFRPRNQEIRMPGK